MLTNNIQLRNIDNQHIFTGYELLPCCVFSNFLITMKIQESRWLNGSRSLFNRNLRNTILGSVTTVNFYIVIGKVTSPHPVR